MMLTGQESLSKKGPLLPWCEGFWSSQDWQDALGKEFFLKGEDIFRARDDWHYVSQKSDKLFDPLNKEKAHRAFHQDDISPDPSHDHGIGGRGAHEPTAYDTDFHASPPCLALVLRPMTAQRNVSSQWMAAWYLMPISWIPAFAGMTGTWLLLSFRRRPESSGFTATYWNITIQPRLGYPFLLVRVLVSAPLFAAATML